MLILSIEPSILIHLSRIISLNLGNGKCKWIPPSYNPEAGTDYFKTLVVGFPGGAKRLVYVQMEGLVGLSVNDEWLADERKKNHPFMKSNYPHHEGDWTWGDEMNQVIMVMRNPRQAIREYHDVLYDIDYADDAEKAYSMMHNLYIKRAPMDNYIKWRDNRTFAEIHWYGWFIDFWMEGGLLRDIMTHKLTTREHFDRQMQPGEYTESGKAFELMVGNAVVEPQYSYHCVVDMPDDSCHPVSIISVDRLVDPSRGAEESAKIAKALDGKRGMDVIAEEARACVWEELILRNKGVRTMRDRTGLSEDSYGFTPEMLSEVIVELTRLKEKYSSPEWSNKQTAHDLVELLEEYIIDINVDLHYALWGDRL